MAHVPIYQPVAKGRGRRLTVRQRLALVAAAGVPLVFAGSALGSGWTAASASAPAPSGGHFADSDPSTRLADVLSGRVSVITQAVPPAAPPLPSLSPAPAPPLLRPVPPVFGALAAFRPAVAPQAPASPTPSPALHAAPAEPSASTAPAASVKPSRETLPRVRTRAVAKAHPLSESQPEHGRPSDVHANARSTEGQDGRDRGSNGDQGGRD